MANRKQEQPIDISPVRKAGLLTEDVMMKDDIVPQLMTNETQMIEQIPNTVNPPVLFENLIEDEKDGNVPEKAVEKLDG